MTEKNIERLRVASDLVSRIRKILENKEDQTDEVLYAEAIDEFNRVMIIEGIEGLDPVIEEMRLLLNKDKSIEDLMSEIKTLGDQIREKHYGVRSRRKKEYCYILSRYPTLEPEEYEILSTSSDFVVVKIGDLAKKYKCDEVAFSLEKYFEKAVEILGSQIKSDNERIVFNKGRISLFKKELDAGKR